MGTRKFSRVNFNVSASIKTADRQFQGLVENLSMNGMFLVSRERLEAGEAVEIAIFLTGSVPEISVAFSGRVIHATDDGLGFIFDSIDPDSYTHLRNIIAYNIDESDKVLEEIHQSIDEKLAATQK